MMAKIVHTKLFHAQTKVIEITEVSVFAIITSWTQPLAVRVFKSRRIPKPLAARVFKSRKILIYSHADDQTFYFSTQYFQLFKHFSFDIL